jgi:hypothetical protein
VTSDGRSLYTSENGAASNIWQRARNVMFSSQHQDKRFSITFPLSRIHPRSKNDGKIDFANEHWDSRQSREYCNTAFVCGVYKNFINTFSPHFTTELSWFMFLPVDLFATMIASLVVQETTRQVTRRLQDSPSKKFGSVPAKPPHIPHVTRLCKWGKWALARLLRRVLALWLFSSFSLTETLSK